jgi:hypothetical protein
MKLIATIPTELNELFTGKSRQDEDPMNKAWFKKLERASVARRQMVDNWLSVVELRQQREFLKRHKLANT